MRMRGSGKMT